MVLTSFCRWAIFSSSPGAGFISYVSLSGFVALTVASISRAWALAPAHTVSSPVRGVFSLLLDEQQHEGSPWRVAPLTALAAAGRALREFDLPQSAAPVSCCFSQQLAPPLQNLGRGGEAVR
jgi:hypothetical protein